jgi:hypothetical protein
LAHVKTISKVSIKCPGNFDRRNAMFRSALQKVYGPHTIPTSFVNDAYCEDKYLAVCGCSPAVAVCATPEEEGTVA